MTEDIVLYGADDEKVYHGFWIPDKNQEVYVAQPDPEGFKKITATYVLFNLLTMKERTMPVDAQKLFLANRLRDVKQVERAYNFAYNAIYKWMVQNHTLRITTEQLKVGRRMLLKRNIPIGTDMETAQKIVTEILLPPQIEFEGEMIWNPSRILLYHFILELVYGEKIDFIAQT